jgi:hypothetical protein
MAGTLPGIANAQQHDVNGLPLSNCLLTVFAGGTTTPVSTFQDIGLAIPAQNPLVGDASGRIPLFFVADGTYHVRLTDQFGIMSNGGFDIPQIPSIGASSSGGGGAAVDPTTVASTGDWKFRPSTEILPGWVRMNGRTIGNATSGASERANADTQALFIYAWSTYPDAKCPVIGGRGSGALADYNGNKQITTLDWRARGPVGLDDMGNTLAGRITSISTPGSSDLSTTPGGYGGEGAHALVAIELPGHTHSGTTGNDAPDHSHAETTFMQSFGLTVAGSGGPAFMGNNVAGQSTGGASARHQHPFTTDAGGALGGQVHNNFQPFVLGTHYWKL